MSHDNLVALFGWTSLGEEKHWQYIGIKYMSPYELHVHYLGDCPSSSWFEQAAKL